MKEINGGKQMRDVWTLPAIARWEKSCGKHPTQKPLCVLSRIIQASTERGAWILDPFTGSSTTGIAANMLGRKFLGIDKDVDFLKISQARKEEISNPTKQLEMFEKLQQQARLFGNAGATRMAVSDNEEEYSFDLPF